MGISRKKATNREIIRFLVGSVIQAMKYEWSDRRNRTIQLDIKEIMRRLEPDTKLTDGEIDEMILG